MYQRASRLEILLDIETSGRIKDDIFQKLQHGKGMKRKRSPRKSQSKHDPRKNERERKIFSHKMEGPICLKSELDLFEKVPIQLSIEGSAFTEIQPVASLSENSPLEFFFSGNGDQYLDLAYSILHLQIKVVKKNAGIIENAKYIAPINYILNTLFS
ncbi:hypothetical protein AVEN_64812-1 [Araneus ventricosus]|uniref:Uncharacterized protein n=1 Tax=Araneus ventricosus TaxID=182803 RepID=A0A4Y2GJW1_ARAVE|nr:hypothetical protein AVEN_64812-1 [Araneus ventricosus]